VVASELLGVKNTKCRIIFSVQFSFLLFIFDWYVSKFKLVVLVVESPIFLYHLGVNFAI
jgi:hypothetical protein